MEKNIIMKEERFCKVGKSWKLVKVVEENITKECYLNIINSCKFFRSLGGYERLTRGYTYAGYIPVELNSISPDRQEKVVRTFTIEKGVGSMYYDRKKKEYKCF